MADGKIRVGVIGSSATYGWGMRAHLPAILALPEYELTAVCTSRPETAAEAARVYGARHAFHDYLELEASPNVDLVVVCVRADKHYEITRAGLRAGKHVFAEWPLGADLGAVRELATLARAQGVCTLVGLQAQGSPEVQHLSNLVAQGYVGQPLVCSMDMTSEPYASYSTPADWLADPEKGARVLWIHAGHVIDAFCLCVGEFREVSGQVSLRFADPSLVTSEYDLPPQVPDAIVASGWLAGGAVATIRVAINVGRGSGWRMEVQGNEGTIVATCPTIMQYGAIAIRGAKAREDVFSVIDVPPELTTVPKETPHGPPFNVAQLYRRLAEGIRSGVDVHPNFDDAVERHMLLDAIAASSMTGRRSLLSRG